MTLAETRSRGEAFGVGNSRKQKHRPRAGSYKARETL